MKLFLLWSSCLVALFAATKLLSISEGRTEQLRTEYSKPHEADLRTTKPVERRPPEIVEKGNQSAGGESSAPSKPAETPPESSTQAAQNGSSDSSVARENESAASSSEKKPSEEAGSSTKTSALTPSSEFEARENVQNVDPLETPLGKLIQSCLKQEISKYVPSYQQVSREKGEYLDAYSAVLVFENTILKIKGVIREGEPSRRIKEIRTQAYKALPGSKEYNPEYQRLLRAYYSKKGAFEKKLGTPVNEEESSVSEQTCKHLFLRWANEYLKETAESFSGTKE